MRGKLQSKFKLLFAAQFVFFSTEVWGGQPARGPMVGALVYFYKASASDSRQGRRIKCEVVN